MIKNTKERVMVTFPKDLLNKAKLHCKNNDITLSTYLILLIHKDLDK